MVDTYTDFVVGSDFCCGTNTTQAVNAQLIYLNQQRTMRCEVQYLMLSMLALGRETVLSPVPSPYFVKRVYVLVLYIILWKYNRNPARCSNNMQQARSTYPVLVRSLYCGNRKWKPMLPNNDEYPPMFTGRGLSPSSICCYLFVTGGTYTWY